MAELYCRALCRFILGQTIIVINDFHLKSISVLFYFALRREGVLSLKFGEMRQNFSIWVYGVHGKFVRGSGLFVGEDGASFDHHFLTPPSNSNFVFQEGIYILEIYLRLLGDKRERRIFNESFELTPDLASAMNTRQVGVYFDWGPDSQRYWPHLDEGPPPTPDAEAFVKALAESAKLSR